jgi:predicted YcjX-like family ATPase
VAIGKKGLRVRGSKPGKGRGAANEAKVPGKAMEALDQAMGMSRGQAEAAFRAAVRKVEEIIQVGKRELDVVRSSAREALDRLVAAAQRARHTTDAEPATVKRAVKRGARKATRGAERATAQVGRKRAAIKWGSKRTVVKTGAKRGGRKPAKKGRS